MIVIFPGSFDPITYGHLDIIERAEALFGNVIVVMLHNSKKKYFFTPEERMEQLQDATKHVKGVQLQIFDGLLMDFAKSQDSRLIIRGVRSVSDYEYELPVAVGIKQLSKDIETFFIPTNPKYSYVSSSMVKELARYKADISELVPQLIQDALLKKYSLIEG